MAKRPLSASPSRARKRHITRSSPSESSNDSHASTEQDSDTDSDANSDFSDTESASSGSERSEVSSSSGASSNDSTDRTSAEDRLDTEGTERAVFEAPTSKENITKAATPQPVTVTDSTVTGNEVEITGTLTVRSRETSYAETVVLPGLAEQRPSACGPTLPYQLADHFPMFGTGDVSIMMVSGPNWMTLQLHSCALAKLSIFFSTSLGEVDPNDPKPNHYFYVVREKDRGFSIVRQWSQGQRPRTGDCDARNGDGEVNVKVEVTEDPSTAPSDLNQCALTIQQLSSKRPLLYWYQIFGTFYNFAPHLSANNIATALEHAEELVKIATQLGSLQVLRPFVANSLAQHRQTLFVSIKNNPIRLMNLALALEDDAIYTECLIHLIGAYKAIKDLAKFTMLPEWLRQLIAKKEKELNEWRIETERDLFSCTIRIDPGNRPVFPVGSQIETWLVVQLFRDTLANRFAALEKSKRLSGTLVRQIKRAGDEYMDYEHVKELCRNILKSEWKDLAHDLKLIKGYAATIVSDLAKNELMIDPDEHGIGYLTCTKVRAQDIPWKQASQK